VNQEHVYALWWPAGLGADVMRFSSSNVVLVGCSLWRLWSVHPNINMRQSGPQTARRTPSTERICYKEIENNDYKYIFIQFW